ncbi:hypothetical protein PC116_g34233 [Phytophthora cactorum]|nr:hypothetical protein PC116_g34233 [Phytophthora cactorum]
MAADAVKAVMAAAAYSAIVSVYWSVRNGRLVSVRDLVSAGLDGWHNG